MLTFKDFIKTINEGGNVQIGDQEAERIDLSKISRDDIVPKIGELLNDINTKYKEANGVSLWTGRLFKSKKFLSGSSFHFFNTGIPTPVFKKYKNQVGDIDTKVDKSMAPEVDAFLTANTGKKFKHATLVGFKKSAGQSITLFAFDEPKINIQIDLEYVDFLNGVPTAWSDFSHSSDWNDVMAGIKGVFHKMLLRALTAKTLREIVILKGKKEVPTKVKSTDLAFSVTSGLRIKIEPVVDNGVHRTIDGLQVYKEIPTTKSTYITELYAMFEVLFGHKPTPSEIKQFGSFIGGCELVKKYFKHNEQATLVLGFANTLWGPGAQGLYRGNQDLDNKEKMIAFNKMVEILGVDFNKAEIEKMHREYYK